MKTMFTDKTTMNYSDRFWKSTVRIFCSSSQLFTLFGAWFSWLDNLNNEENYQQIHPEFEK